MPQVRRSRRSADVEDAELVARSNLRNVADLPMPGWLVGDEDAGVGGFAVSLNHEVMEHGECGL
jgi:hypothetical protein